jgi:hypothetical protein
MTQMTSLYCEEEEIMTAVHELDVPVPDQTISGMREIQRRAVSLGKNQQYDLVVFWDPADGKIYLAKVIDEDHLPSPHLLEIKPGEIGEYLDHPAMIRFE